MGRSHDNNTAQPNSAPPRPRVLGQTYARRVFTILAVGLLAGVALKIALKPRGFGELGHFRTGAIADERAHSVVHIGKQVCAECHPEQFRKHEKDVHVTVQCEDCHGPATVHVEARRAHLPLDKGFLPRNTDSASCLVCHALVEARPKMFPTINPAQHFSFLSVTEPKTPCKSCHAPHEPIFLEKRVAEARIHPLIHPCNDCHRDPTIVSKPLPQGHVVTFQCQDCHAEIMADFKKKSHRFFDCTVCHLFHQESEFSGRIFKIRSAQFCLMCHLSKPFQDPREMPNILSVESHLDRYAQSPADRAKQCIDCHQEPRIHTLDPRGHAAADAGVNK